jgi:hypothetical protein
MLCESIVKLTLTSLIHPASLSPLPWVTSPETLRCWSFEQNPISSLCDSLWSCLSTLNNCLSRLWRLHCFASRLLWRSDHSYSSAWFRSCCIVQWRNRACTISHRGGRKTKTSNWGMIWIWTTVNIARTWFGRVRWSYNGDVQSWKEIQTTQSHSQSAWNTNSSEISSVKCEILSVSARIPYARDSCSPQTRILRSPATPSRLRMSPKQMIPIRRGFFAWRSPQLSVKWQCCSILPRQTF